MSELVPITALRRGQIAEVGQLHGNADQVRRLEELGLRAGTRLEIVRSGAPCIVRVNDTKLCFRDDDTVRVLVRVRMSA